MIEISQLASVDFPDWYDTLAEFEHSHKGYLNNVMVRMLNGKKYSLSFIDPSRLQQNLDDNVTEGVHCFTERNLVVIPAVTKTNILLAIEAMLKDGLYEHTFLPGS